MLDEDGHSCFYRVCTHELLNPVEHDKSGLKTIRASDAGTGDCSSATSPPKSEGLCLSSSIHNVHAGSFNRGRQRTKRRHPLLLLTPLSCSSKFTLPESPLSAHASSVASPHVLRARIITQPTNRLQAPACARLCGRCRLRAGSGPTSRHSSAGGERTVSETPARFSLFCSPSSTADTAGSQPPIIPALTNPSHGLPNRR